MDATPTIDPGHVAYRGADDRDSFLALARQRGPLKRLLSMGPAHDVVAYDIQSPRWQADPLRMAILTDIHAMRPWMPVRALRRYVDEINAMELDIIFILGDFTTPHHTPGVSVDPDKMVRTLTDLQAPLGTHIILGNHDWIDDKLAKEKAYKTSEISQALVEYNMNPIINTSRRVTHNGKDLWIVGLDSQTAKRDGTGEMGRHKPDQAFADVPDESLAILLAHEPDYFVFGDKRPVLQLSGHTHGGQANFFGWRPFTPSEYHQRYAYGHVVEDGQHLVVSGGVGYTHVPLRIAQPPEITLVRMSAEG